MFCSNQIGCLALAGALALMVSSPISAFLDEPTPAEIASGWAALGGGKDGFVVYNHNDSVFLLSLKTGEAKKLITVKQAVLGTSTSWGKASALRISPDGNRIAAEGGGGLFVFNRDGTNLKQIMPFSPSGDQISISWDGNDKVVYSPSKTKTPPFVINSTVVNPDNSPGATTVLWSSAIDKEPSGTVAGSQGLVSITKSGDYLSFDIQGDVNVPIIVKLSTKETRNPTNGGDGCQIRLWPDGSGTASYHIVTHMVAATLYHFAQDKIIGTVPLPTVPQGACGNGGFNWAYDKDFMIQTGDNDIGTNPGCITSGRIRKTSWDKSLYLGNKIGWPDMWVGTVSTGLLTPQYETLHSTKSQVWFSNNRLRVKGIDGKIIAGLQLIDLSGSIVAQGENISIDQQDVSIEGLPQGVYVLTWRQSGKAMSRAVNILSGFSDVP